MPEYKLPDVGEGLTEAEIVSWKVRVGDVVKVNDIVVEIETAKSLVELPSPYAGTVQALHATEGETVQVGTSIIAIGDGAAPATEPVPAGGSAPASSSGDFDPSNPAASGDENQTLVGYGPRAAASQRRVRRPAVPSSHGGSETQSQLQGAFEPGGPHAPEDGVDVQKAVEPAEPAEPADAAGRVRDVGRSCPHGGGAASAGQAPGPQAGEGPRGGPGVAGPHGSWGHRHP